MAAAIILLVFPAGALSGECPGTSEGTLKGPQEGDTGNWGIVWGS